MMISFHRNERRRNRHRTLPERGSLPFIHAFRASGSGCAAKQLCDAVAQNNHAFRLWLQSAVRVGPSGYWGWDQLG